MRADGAVREYADAITPLAVAEGISKSLAKRVVAAKLDGAWWTPPVAAGLLPGTYRAALIDEGRLRERDLPLDLVRRADEIAVVNSVRGWRPAVLRSAP